MPDTDSKSIIPYTGIDLIDRLFAIADVTPNTPNRRTRDILHSAERYLFDFDLDMTTWEQFDTDSDAWYFGIWLNRTRLWILTYAEGDISLTECDDAEAYDAFLACLCAFHGTTPEFITIDVDAKASTHYYQDRSQLFIDPARAEAALKSSSASGAEAGE